MKLKTQLGRNNAVDRVPAELWSGIFRFATYFTPHETILARRFAPGSLNPKNPLLVIENVCSVWRTVIRSLPTLWSTILLQDCWSIPEGAKKDLPAFISTRLRTLSDILSHSRDCPLTIVIGTPGVWDSPPLLVPALLILAQHCPRWFNLCIWECSDNMIAPSLVSALSLSDVKSLPLLEEMALSLETDSSLIHLKFPPFTCNFPKLRSIDCYYDCPPPGTLPFGQLTAINFDGMNSDRCRQLLPHLRSAVQIHMVSWIWDFDWLESPFNIFGFFPDPFTLPDLQRFHVEMWDDHSMSFMTAPNLTELEINTLAGKHLSSIADMVIGSKCTLKKLLFHELLSDQPYATGSIDSDLSEVLSSSPSLQVLLLKVEERDLDSLLESLCERKHGRMTYCPNLQDLTICCNALVTNPSRLSKLLDVFEARLSHSRADSSSPILRKVGGIPIWNDDFPTEYRALFSRLDDMKREGLEVSYVEYKNNED